MVTEDGYFLMVDIGVCLLEGFSCCGERVVNGGNGVGVMRAWVCAGWVCGCEKGSLDGLYSCGDALEC